MNKEPKRVVLISSSPNNKLVSDIGSLFYLCFFAAILSVKINYYITQSLLLEFIIQWVQTNFRELWNQYNSSHAIPYELRHHYAIENINSWTDEGFGFDAKLLYLSKSMGHSTLESTKYYYSLVPGMADILEEKTGMDFESIVPEVDCEESDE